MFRAFKITLPADTNNHNLFSLIVGTAIYGAVNGGTNETAITGAIPTTDYILPANVSSLEIQADLGNAGTITVNDRNYTNTTGKVLNPGDVSDLAASTNSIDMRDFFIQGSVDSLAIEVRMNVN
jgi:hypothetical protein